VENHLINTIRHYRDAPDSKLELIINNFTHQEREHLAALSDRIQQSFTQGSTMALVDDIDRLVHRLKSVKPASSKEVSFFYKLYHFFIGWLFERPEKTTREVIDVENTLQKLQGKKSELAVKNRELEQVHREYTDYFDLFEAKIDLLQDAINQLQKEHPNNKAVVEKLQRHHLSALQNKVVFGHSLLSLHLETTKNRELLEKIETFQKLGITSANLHLYIDRLSHTL
jgi:uncharacterized protein YaaN involved in tellurite resistance